MSAEVYDHVVVTEVQLGDTVLAGKGTMKRWRVNKIRGGLKSPMWIVVLLLRSETGDTYREVSCTLRDRVYVLREEG